MDESYTVQKVAVALTGLTFFIVAIACSCIIWKSLSYGKQFKDAVSDGYTVTMSGRQLTDAEIEDVRDNIFNYKFLVDENASSIILVKNKIPDNGVDRNTTTLLSAVGMVLMIFGICIRVKSM